MHRAGDADRAELFESTRAQRIILAVLGGAGDAVVELVAGEVGDCDDCRGRLAAYALAMCSANLVTMGGGIDQAIEFLKTSLFEDLDRLALPDL